MLQSAEWRDFNIGKKLVKRAKIQNKKMQEIHRYTIEINGNIIEVQD